MKVSIITIVRNGQHTIKDCMRSVLNQTHKEIQYILIDGASEDDTLKNIQSVKLDFPLANVSVISERDKGIYFAMNKGIGLANGTIVGLLNADDVYQNEHVIADVVDTFVKSDADCLYGDLVYTQFDNLEIVKRNWKSGEINKYSFMFGWMPPHPTFFVKNSIYEKYGLFNTNLKSAADYELMLRFVYKQQIKTAYLPKILVRMRSGGLSNSSIMNRIRANREDKMAWKINKLKPYFFTLWLKPIRKITQFLK